MSTDGPSTSGATQADTSGVYGRVSNADSFTGTQAAKSGGKAVVRTAVVVDTSGPIEQDLKPVFVAFGAFGNKSASGGGRGGLTGHTFQKLCKDTKVCAF